MNVYGSFLRNSPTLETIPIVLQQEGGEGEKEKKSRSTANLPPPPISPFVPSRGHEHGPSGLEPLLPIKDISLRQSSTPGPLLADFSVLLKKSLIPPSLSFF